MKDESSAEAGLMAHLVLAPVAAVPKAASVPEATPALVPSIVADAAAGPTPAVEASAASGTVPEFVVDFSDDAVVEPPAGAHAPSPVHAPSPEGPSAGLPETDEVELVVEVTPEMAESIQQQGTWKCVEDGCKRTFKWAGSMAAHWHAVHEAGSATVPPLVVAIDEVNAAELKPYQCSACERRFKTAEARDAHWGSVHSDEAVEWLRLQQDSEMVAWESGQGNSPGKGGSSSSGNRIPVTPPKRIPKKPQLRPPERPAPDAPGSAGPKVSTTPESSSRPKAESRGSQGGSGARAPGLVPPPPPPPPARAGAGEGGAEKPVPVPAWKKRRLRRQRANARKREAAKGKGKGGEPVETDGPSEEEGEGPPRAASEDEPPVRDELDRRRRRRRDDEDEGDRDRDRGGGTRAREKTRCVLRSRSRSRRRSTRGREERRAPKSGGRRRDVHDRPCYTRGNLEDAEAGTLDRHALAAAVVELRKGAYSVSSAKPRAARLKTWDAIAIRLGHVDQDTGGALVQLSEQLVVDVCAALKVGGYRSSELYLHEALMRHRKARFAVSEDLWLLKKDLERSLKRGRGPAAQAQPLDVPMVLKLPASWDDAAGAPRGQRDCVVVATWWMLREIEIASARVDDARVAEAADGSRIGCLEVASSKVDQCAEGTGMSLALRCICRGQLHSNSLCPVCALERQMDVARVSEVPGSPLFPSNAGQQLEKADVVAWLEGTATRCGTAVVDAQGRKRIRGHTCRVTGAMMLASLGIARERIKALGRWAGDSVDRYIRRAPSLVTLTISTDAMKPNDCAMAVDMHSQEREFVACLRPGGRLHVVLVGSILVPPSRWRAKCGWRFGEADSWARRGANMGDLPNCPLCFQERKLLGLAGGGC